MDGGLFLCWEESMSDMALFLSSSSSEMAVKGWISGDVEAFIRRGLGKYSG